jgi:hypothetical protein
MGVQLPPLELAVQAGSSSTALASQAAQVVHWQPLILGAVVARLVLQAQVTQVQVVAFP